ncbi:hypothetical protein N7492_002421 [Penicillium capsulatum]|uniref:Rhodopsin domain-containing protein n=1 Tax=Penicillium capsulatum TaxID=69766 RepID=A0A9W9ILD1_9EURO|nr:hypothetical protein N7492_002421 [Penicillium capsulatum]
MSLSALNLETFVEYAIGMSFFLARLGARLHVSGFDGLRLDDAFAVAAMIFWTLQTAIIYVLNLYGSNIGLDTQTAMLVPASQFPKMILGSKLAFMNWIWYMCYIWCCKGVLLCLYFKLTQGTWHRKLVWGSVGFCVFTATGKFNPTPGPLYIVIAVFNVLSDILILIIPIPILTKLQVPLQRKLILAVMFSSGIFIMICTILRAHYSLGDITHLPIALGWADRECFVAAIVVSLPGIKPLFRNTKWLGSSNRKPSNTPYSNSGYNNFNSKTSGKTKTFISSRRSGSLGRHFEMDSVMRTEKSTRVSTGGSEEYILDDAKTMSMSSRPVPHESPSTDPLSIHVTTELSVQEGSRAPKSSGGGSFA